MIGAVPSVRVSPSTHLSVDVNQASARKASLVAVSLLSVFAEVLLYE